MKKIKNFIELTRLNKPIGFMLLFWPCAWGLSLAYYFTKDITIYFKYLIFFFLGAVLMRSVGCIFNDIVDKDIDAKVERTKSRPIASGKISVLESFIYIFFLCLLAFFILLQFNIFTIILGMSSMILAFAYPFMKRITYWPQLFLGLTFNWGIIMGWSSITNNISIEPLLLYISAVFWTLGYDTIYGLQDMNDDEIIGVKSTSIKFKDNVKIFVSICYFLCISFILSMFFLIEVSRYSLLLSTPFIFLFIYQIRNFNKDKPETCLAQFKNNNFSGFFIFIFIFSFNIL
jgi:4-hydroxybenzoate polyprenyl transferase